MAEIIPLPETKCGYLPDKQSRMVYAFYGPISEASTYPDEYRKFKFEKLQQGFLAQSFSVCATICNDCNACLPLRINTSKFKYSDGHERILKRASKAGLIYQWERAMPFPQLYPLYKKYVQTRHPQSEMVTDSADDFYANLSTNTDLLIIGTEKSLKGFARIDRLDNEASLEYIAFDPSNKKLSLGTLAWLNTIEWTKTQKIDHIYIGQINPSQSMLYKANFRGLETIVDGEWVDFDPKIHTSGPNFHAMLKAEGLNL
ncbi:MAG: hypothetical protein CMH31_03750 [Micavibrio sp.]|nr:hypothetical protein [Micavibrio sp.]|tara:strand:+ start:120 stop:893 length:774 start_codon:yes stop_codon:yes gene_type:complete